MKNKKEECKWESFFLPDYNQKECQAVVLDYQLKIYKSVNTNPNFLK